MKQVNLFKPFSNPSYLGADRLWDAGSDELIGREDTTIGVRIGI